MMAAKGTMPERNLNTRQFFHGTNQEREEGDVIDPKQPHERVHRSSFPNSAYFTKYAEEAAMHAQFAVNRSGGEPHVYKVEPTGSYQPDTQQRQGGSYTTQSPLRITGEHK
jgi:hypothetical protein